MTAWKDRLWLDLAKYLEYWKKKVCAESITGVTWKKTPVVF